MTMRGGRGDAGTDQPAGAEGPRLIFTIRFAEGAEARRLRREQTAAIVEVAQWVAQQQSGSGSTPTAA
jgi:hypothetical protein